MARPRVFISSTFYDLKQVRTELERFIKEQGYEPVLNERGHIAYGKEEPLEEYCYKEIGGVDMLVSIVGGRFGSESLHKEKSISQIELDTAFKQNKQVYIFIDKNVHAEYGTYEANKGNDSTVYKHVTDRRVYEYLDQVMKLPLNNQISPFELTREITEYLKEQWAGLFQRLLQDSTKRAEASVLSGLQASLQTVNQLVTYITEERKNQDDAIKRIIMYNHPIFEQLKGLVGGVEYRVFFTNHNELSLWLRARQFSAVDESAWDAPKIEEWIHSIKGTQGAADKERLLKIQAGIFDKQGVLKPYTAAEWNKQWVTIEDRIQAEDDEIPF